jgi:hypothetical protein
MKKWIAAGAVVAAAAGSLLGFAGHASAQSVCVTVRWSFPDPSSTLPVGLPVALPIPFAGSQTQCLSPDSLPTPPGGLPTLP